jgi:RNA polymerase sigma-70 factor (ECF subfamily)
MTYPLKPDEARDAGWGVPPGISPEAGLEALRRRLVQFAIKIVWNRDDAEEIVQEAFRLAATKGVAIRDVAFGPWMARTTANLAMNLRRRRRPEPMLESIEPASGDTPATRAERAERLERVRSAIESLPPRQRLAITLRTMEQMDYAGVAAIMECSEAAARTHVHLARSRLAELLTEDAHPSHSSHESHRSH